MNSKLLYLRLLHYVMPHWRIFLAAIAGMVVVAASEPAFAALLKPMLDGTFVAKDQSWIRLIPLLIVLLFLVRGIAMYLSTYAINWLGQQLVLKLRGEMFARLLRLPTTFFDNHPSGNLIAHIAFNVTQVMEAGTTAITVLVRDSLSIAGLLGWMLYVNWKLTLITFFIGPAIAIIVSVVSKRLRQLSRLAQQSLGDISGVLQEVIDGQREIKIFEGSTYETRRFSETIRHARRYNIKYMMISAASVSIVQLIAALALAVIVFMASQQSAADKITVGGFISFFTAMLLLFPPLKRLTSVNEQMQKGLAAAEIVFGLVDERPETDSGSATLGHSQGAIRLENLCLTYPGNEKPALNNINLDIAPGETIALVGQSGSGKTSLVNLLPRFYPISSGRILIDGHDIAELTLESLRQNIALVSQQVVLFNDTVAANIAYGRDASIPLEQIVAAAHAAHAMEFIDKLPHGIQTHIGEKGVKLSGGQRQRLAIARALLKDAPILILDEATSALDTASERHVQAALESLMQNRTTIVIAHRLSTIEKADRIVVMHQGEITEVGTHHELLARGGLYAQLHRIQFSEQRHLTTPADQSITQV